MKFYKNIKIMVLAWGMLCCVAACSTETRQGANRDFQEFADWVEENSLRAETATEEEWNEMDAEYNRRATELEKKSAEWDDKTKAEWDELNDRWYETEGKAETRFRDTEMEPAADSASTNF